MWGLVLVKNDALNSNHETAVSYLLKDKDRCEIDLRVSRLERRRRILSRIKFIGKTEKMMWGRTHQEQYLQIIFNRFTKYPDPEIAIPFAPGFLITNEKQMDQWHQISKENCEQLL